MATWVKEEIELKDGTFVAAQMPVCHYCSANTNNAAAMANWKRHCECSNAETITGKIAWETGWQTCHLSRVQIWYNTFILYGTT